MMMTAHKNRLQSVITGRYIPLAAAKSAVGHSTPDITKAHNRAEAVFLCAKHCHIRIMVRRAGQPSGWPASLVTGSGIPVRLTTLEHSTSGGELSKFTKEDATPWQTADHARTLSAPTTRPKSTAACTAPIHWRISCNSISDTPNTAQCRYGCHTSSATLPMIFATYSSYSKSQTRTSNFTAMPARVIRAGGFRTRKNHSEVQP